MMEITKFDHKLNKVDGKVYVIEEEIRMPDGGVYEAPLQHDNITVSTLNVYTGSKLTGDRIQTYALSTPSLTPWKRIIRIQTGAPVVYISYETDGDTVEADDVNSLQDAVVGTQEGVNAEESRALAAEKALDVAVKAEAARAGAAEKKLGEDLAAETGRAQNREAEITRNLAAEESRALMAEASIRDGLEAEESRAAAKETELQGNIDAHRAAVAGEVQALKAADAALDEKKADAADMNRELGNRYTKDQVFTKEEVLKKVEDLIGAAPETLDTFREIADALGNDPNFAATIMNLLAGKVDKEAGKQLTSNDYSNSEKALLADVNAKKHTHGNKAVLDKVTQALLDAWSAAYSHVSDAVKHVTAAERAAWNDAGSKKHTHGNKTVIDKLTQAMLDKLAGIAAGAEVNVQPDWNVTDTGSDAFIKNKPSSLPASDVPAWAKAAAKPAYSWTEIGGRPASFPPASHTHAKSQITDMPTKVSQFTNDAGYITQSDVDTSQNHTHVNKTVLDKVTQAMLDKLAGIAEGANKYIHPATAGNKHIPSGGAASQILRWSADGTAVWGADNNTDTKMTQINTTGSADYRLLLSANANDTTETNTGRKSANFRANPSTGEFYAKGFRRVDITGQTVDINTLNLSAGAPQIMRYIERTTGGAANITNLPLAGQPFLLEVEIIRWASVTDYITMQTFRSVSNKAAEYVRFCTNGTWSGWVTRVFTDTKYTHPNSGAAAGTYRSVTVNAQGHVTGGSNPTTLAGYGITDAAAKSHNHDGVYLKKGAMKWADLGGG